MTLRELMEKRARLVAEMRQMNDDPEGEAGDLSESQTKKFDVLKGELELVEKQAERTRLIDEADRRAADGVALTGDSDQNFDRECRQFSLTRAIAGAAGLDVDCGREREVSAEINRRAGGKFQGVAAPAQIFEKRVVTTTAPAAGPGANIIAQDFRGDLFIDLLRSNLVTAQLGGTVLSGLSGNVDIPRLKESAVSGWVAENAALTKSDHQFAVTPLRPKHAGALTEFSRNMLLQSTPDIEMLIRADFAAVLARAIDKAALVGGGADEPVGVLSTAGVDTATSLAAPAWGSILDLIDVVEENDSTVTGFAVRPRVKNALRKTLVTDGDASFVMAADGTLAGYPAVASTQLPPGALIAGNWADLIIGYWSAFDLLVNPYASDAYEKGNVQVRGMLTADVALRHADSFAAAIDGPGAV